MQRKIALSPFYVSLFVLAFAYLAYQLYLIPRLALAVDEFVFARHIYDYTFSIPYLDFPPYKTTLGYYLLSLPFFLSHAVLAPLFYVKEEIAVINMLCIIIAGWWGMRFFDTKALLFTLALVLINQFFLIYSSDLRVDMLTAWCCLFAIFAALEYRPALAGILLGIAFLISQKALWYMVAIDGAFIFCRMMFFHPLFTLRALLRLNVCILLPIVIYIAFWSLIVSPSIVLSSMFYEAYIQAELSWYQTIYLLCWKVVLSHGPVLFLCWPMTFLFQLDTNKMDEARQRQTFIFSCASIVLLEFISYKQPFPYNFMFLVPAYFILYACFFSWLKGKLVRPTEAARSPLASPWYYYFALIYTICLVGFIYAVELPSFYFLMAVLPLLLYAYLARPTKLFYFIGVVILILTGMIYPLYSTINAGISLDGRYQQATILLTAKLLQDGGDYVSGVPYLYQKDQPIKGMKNLIGPEISYIEKPDDKIIPILLPSIYLAPTTQNEIIHELETRPVKVIINNYRMQSLPPKIIKYIKDHYQQFYGSVYLYSPVVKPEQMTFEVKFKADYRIVAPTLTIVSIDQIAISANDIVKLDAGGHFTTAKDSYRLALVPELNILLNPAYKSERSGYMSSPIIGAML